MGTCQVAVAEGRHLLGTPAGPGSKPFSSTSGGSSTTNVWTSLLIPGGPLGLRDTVALETMAGFQEEGP